MPRLEALRFGSWWAAYAEHPLRWHGITKLTEPQYGPASLV